MARLCAKKIICSIFRIIIDLTNRRTTKILPLLINKKILVISCEGIGNNILSIPLIYTLRQNAKNCQIDVLTSSASHKIILENTRCAHNISILSKKFFGRVIQYLKLRNNHYDFCFLTFPTLSLTKELIPFFIRSKYNISHNYQMLHEFFFYIKNLYQLTVEIDPDSHDIEQNLNLIRGFSLPIHEFKKYPEFYFTANALKFAQDYFKNQGILSEKFVIAIHPGSSKGGLYKRWPIQNFVLLANTILADLNAMIIFILGPDEAELKMHLNIDNIRFLEAHRIDYVAAVLAKCNLFISNDSGVMHLAALTDIPIITIWGGTDEKRIGARATHVSNVINHHIDCRPCIKLIPIYPCRDKDYKCINDISVAEVVQVVKKEYEKNFHAAVKSVRTGSESL